MIEGAIIGGLIGLIYATFAYFRAKAATGLEYLKAMPKRVAAFDSAKSPAEVIAALGGGLPEAKAQAVASDPATNTVLLAQTPSFNAWGFFFPVRATAKPSGGSRVEVGIASRSFMWGAAVTKVHNVAVGQVKTLLGAA